MITVEDRRVLIHLLDRLCGYEETVVECGTLENGEIPRNDAISAREVMKSRRVLRRAQTLMIAIERNWGEIARVGHAD